MMTVSSVIVPEPEKPLRLVVWVPRARLWQHQVCEVKFRRPFTLFQVLVWDGDSGQEPYVQVEGQSVFVPRQYTRQTLSSFYQFVEDCGSPYEHAPDDDGVFLRLPDLVPHQRSFYALPAETRSVRIEFKQLPDYWLLAGFVDLEALGS